MRTRASSQKLSLVEVLGRATRRWSQWIGHFSSAQEPPPRGRAVTNWRGPGQKIVGGLAGFRSRCAGSPWTGEQELRIHIRRYVETCNGRKVCDHRTRINGTLWSANGRLCTCTSSMADWAGDLKPKPRSWGRRVTNLSTLLPTFRTGIGRDDSQASPPLQRRLVLRRAGWLVPRAG